MSREDDSSRQRTEERYIVMAKRPVLRRRGVAPAAPVQKAPAPAVVKAKVKPIVEEVDDDDDPEDDYDPEDDDDDPEPEPVVVKKPVVVAKAKVKPVVEDDDDGDDDGDDEPVKLQKAVAVKVKPVDATVAGSMMLELLEGFAEDSSIVITRVETNKWIISNSLPEDTKSDRLSGAEYWREVQDPKHAEWNEEWSKLTNDEKLKKAKKAGVTWKEDKDPRVNIMRATAAYKEAMGIEKYKPEYRTRAARAAVRG